MLIINAVVAFLVTIKIRAMWPYKESGCFDLKELNEILSKNGVEGDFLTYYNKEKTIAEGKYAKITRITLGGGKRAQNSEALFDFAVKTFIYYQEKPPKEIRIYEALRTKNLKHVVKYYGCLIDNNKYYLLYQYFGQSLALWDSNKQNAEALDFQELSVDNKLKIFAQMTECVAELHKNEIIHNDVKLSNFLYRRLNGDFEIKIIDFDLSNFQNDNSYSGSIFLMDRIMSEIALSTTDRSGRNSELVDNLLRRKDHFKTDLHALAMAIFELAHCTNGSCDSFGGSFLSPDTIPQLFFFKTQFIVSNPSWIGDKGLNVCNKKNNICFGEIFKMMYNSRSLKREENKNHKMATYAESIAIHLFEMSNNPTPNEPKCFFLGCWQSLKEAFSACNGNEQIQELELDNCSLSTENILI
jgi:serine/threonine protein kinase